MRLPLPTALGLKAALFYAVLVGAFLAAPYANLYFLLLVFLSVLGALNLLWSLLNLAGVRAGVEDPGPAPAGAGQTVTLSLRSGRRLRLALCFELGIEGLGRIEMPVGAARGDSHALGRIPPLPRGVHRVTKARLVSSWPLGLVRTRVGVPGPAELVVYPAPADLPKVSGGSGGGGDIIDAYASREGMLQPSALREYRPGDEVRSVHWRATARRGTPVVKEWDGGVGSGIEVALDRRADRESFEEALSVLAALTLAARDEKELLTLHTQGLSATFGPEHRPFDELLRFLAAAERLPESGAPPPPVSPGTLRLPRPARGGRP